MEFGRTLDFEGVDFTLVPFARPHRRATPSAPERRIDLRLGAPAWGRTHWVGRVYGRGTRPGDMLTSYARHYGAIELNSTFYSLPSERIVDGWVATTPSDFRFCPKLPRALSHAPSLGVGTELFASVVGRFARFGERLGPCWLQLPPTFGARELPVLASFLSQWPRALPLAVELRCASWFSQRRVLPVAAELLAALGVCVVVTDVAGRRDVAHGTLTSRDLFVRFVGNAHPSDEARLGHWLEQLAHAEQLGVERAWFFVHQPDDVAAPESLSMAATLFERGLDVPVRAWHPTTAPPASSEPDDASSEPTRTQLDLFR